VLGGRSLAERLEKIRVRPSDEGPESGIGLVGTPSADCS
jgi:hypothetical protein